MAKINATYSSGYYISPDTDFRRLEEKQTAEKKSLRKRARDGEDAGEDFSDPDVLKANTKRQTFAIPFDLYCEHCKRRIARGAHVYTNRRPTKTKYLGAIRVWELEIRCQYCSGLYYLQTDPETPKETGGYKCVRGCRRVEGDYLALNAKNEAARAQWEKEKAEAEASPLAALERENEASRQLAERNRRIEEDVLAYADSNDGELLAALRARRDQPPSPQSTASVALAGSAASLSRSALAPDSSFAGDESDDEDDGVVRTPEEAAAEEAEYRRFEQDMEERWLRARALHAGGPSMPSSTASAVNASPSSAASLWFTEMQASSGAAGRGGDDRGALAAALARYSSPDTAAASPPALSSRGSDEAVPSPPSSGGTQKPPAAADAAADAADGSTTLSGQATPSVRRSAFALPVSSDSDGDSDAEEPSRPAPVAQAQKRPGSLLSSLLDDDDS